MNRTGKASVVDEMRQRLTRLPNIYLTDFTGLSVKHMTDLRKRFRTEGVEYVVLKNTLARRALQQADIKGLDAELNGPTGFVLSEDPVAAARIISDFQRESEILQVKVGLVEGRTVSPDDVKRLARLPGREALLGQLAGGMQSPLQWFVGALQGIMNQMVGALEALRAQRADAA